jgi:hypothetical protein
MDPTAAADSSGMASLLRLVAVIASTLILLSFFAFASDEAGKGSKEQEAKLAQELQEPAPAPSTERERERRHGPVREKIDDGNDMLVAPFSGVITSTSLWTERIVTGLLALLTYGVGLTMLANFLPRRKAASSDWRTAAD